MLSQLQQLKKEILKKLEEIKDEKTLQNFEIEILGRKGKLTKILRGISELPLEERKKVGKLANELKELFENRIQTLRKKILENKYKDIEKKETIDFKKLGIIPSKEKGALHLIPSFIDQIKKIALELGYEILEGPEIETDWYNFESLNIPKDHPARDLQDTFYLDIFNKEPYLLRTHTTNMQVHIMEKRKPPIKTIVIGRVYRRDDDPTHSPMFHQFDALVVDKGIKLSDLKGTLELFFKKLLGEDINIRFRTSYFPFTEPSIEVDITCTLCKGKGCGVCKGTGWLEMAGAGMVHPNVFKNAGYDPALFKGFAFGAGIERPLMIKHKIENIRVFFENDLRFLEQFKE